MTSEICSKCNQPKKMYYKLWCPRCDKPKVEDMKILNLLKCLHHIEAIGNPGYKERVWNYLSDSIQGNESIVALYNEQTDDNKDIKLLFDIFDIKDESMLFFVSW